MIAVLAAWAAIAVPIALLTGCYLYLARGNRR